MFVCETLQLPWVLPMLRCCCIHTTSLHELETLQDHRTTADHHTCNIRCEVTGRLYF
jgi:hypothetical protein